MEEHAEARGQLPQSDDRQAAAHRLENGVSVEEEEDAYAKLGYMLDQMEGSSATGHGLPANPIRSPTSPWRR